MRIRSIENNRRGATMYIIIITSSRDKQTKRASSRDKQTKTGIKIMKSAIMKEIRKTNLQLDRTKVAYDLNLPLDEEFNKAFDDAVTELFY